MHGLGNDYIYIDCYREPVPVQPNSLAVAMSDRHFGVGGDGIVLIMPSRVADTRMRMFNADGSEGMMCGNAIRCVARYVYEEGYVHDTELSVETASGLRHLRIETDRQGRPSAVTVDMGQARFGFTDREIMLDSRTFRGTQVDVGNPHLVIPTAGVDAFPLSELGPGFEHHELFPDRVNTEIVEQLGPTELRMRVWERGSGETMACGTGASATVAACCRLGMVPFDTAVTVRLNGGALTIIATQDYRLFMSGPAARVFEGDYINE